MKAIKLFCEMNDLSVRWKKLTRGLPKAKNYADDRVPTIGEIQKIIGYPDWRIKAIVFTMASSGIRLGAWDLLKWGHIIPMKRDGLLVAAKIIVYADDPEQYFSFISPEAYLELKKWMDFRKDAGEGITKESWVMRDLWNTRLACRRGGNIGVALRPLRLKSSGIKRLMEDALWAQGIRKKLEPGKKRHEFQVDHGYRKWFKTQCELAGMRSINIEKLMGHSIGISDSYYRITENDLLNDYLNAVHFLTISESTILKEQATQLSQQTKEIVHEELKEKNVELQQIKEHDQMNMDAIAALSDQVMKLMREVELLKKNRTTTRGLTLQ